MKLRTKLMLITVVIVIFAIFLSTFLIITFTKENTKDTIIADGIKDFDTFYVNFSKSMAYSGTEQAHVFPNSHLRYCFLNISGSSEFALQQSDDIISNNIGVDVPKALASSDPAMVNLPGTALHVQYTFFNIGGQDLLLISSPFTLRQQEYTLSFARDITETMDNIDALGAKCIFAGSMVVLLAGVAVLLLVRRSLKPVSELERGARKIAEGNYESRIGLKGRDEIAIVADQFNKMAEAISDKIAALHETAAHRQAFIDNLSHELKTPIASIMGRAETLLGREITEEDRNHSLTRIYHQCAWLERLSGKLMTLVMLQGEIEKKRESVVELFASVAETVSETLEANGMELHADCKMGALNMDFDLMRSALVNLIDNARKASERGSVIALNAHENIIEVKDCGGGIPPDEIAHITEPFYMVDRSRSKKSGGSGLGLALVRRIAEVHGAEMEIISTLGKGTVVKLIFAPDDVDKKITFS